jgi:hypothetical protein
MSRIPISPEYNKLSRYLRREAQTYVIGENTTIQANLPLDGIITRLWIRCDYTLTIGGITAAVAHVHNAANFIQNITLQAGVFGELFNTDGLSAYLMAGARHRVMPQADNFTTAELDAAAVYTGSVEIPIDFSSIGVDMELLGLLMAKHLSALQLTVRFGAVNNDIAHTANANVTSMVGVMSIVREFVMPDQYDTRGYANQIVRQQFLSPPIVGTNAVALEPHKRHRDLLIVSKATAANILADTVVTGLRLRVESSTILHELNDEDIRTKMQTEWHLPKTDSNGAAMDWTGTLYVPYGRLAGFSDSFNALLDARSRNSLTAEVIALAPAGANIRVTQGYYDGV